MALKETLVLVFLITFVLHWFWCLHLAYPLVLDKSIKKGQSWLYLPLKWKGLFKAMVSITTPVILLFLLILGVFVLWLYTKQLPIYHFAGCSMVLISFVLFFHSFLLKYRFRQQEDSYFFIRRQLSQKMESSGKRLTETEINNLASFQHQNMLREADMSGKLKETLANQSSLAKKKRKTGKIKIK
jgi:hypothetical protein